jgi:hypothetical protein
VEQYFLTKKQIDISEVTEKAYVSFDQPTLNLDTGEIIIPVENFGDTPSGLGGGQVHIGLFNTTSNQVIEVQRLLAPIAGVPPKKPDELREHLIFDSWSPDHAQAVTNGTEYVAVAGMIKYDNNFGPTTSLFCSRTRHWRASEIFWTVCDPITVGRQLQSAWNERHENGHP